MTTAHGDYECDGCESFAHDPSFTHDAIAEVSGVDLSIPPRTFDPCQYSYHELAYMHGLDTPHYQVPAIPYEVSIAGALVAVFHEQTKSISYWTKPDSVPSMLF